MWGGSELVSSKDKDSLSLCFILEPKTLGKASWNQLSNSIIFENHHIDLRTSTSLSASADTSHCIFFPASALKTKHYSYSTDLSILFYSYWSHCCCFGIFFHCKCMVFKAILEVNMLLWTSLQTYLKFVTVFLQKKYFLYPKQLNWLKWELSHMKIHYFP